MEFIRNQKYKISINEIGGGLNSIIDLESKKELIHEVNDLSRYNDFPIYWKIWLFL